MFQNLIVLYKTKKLSIYYSQPYTETTCYLPSALSQKFSLNGILQNSTNLEQNRTENDSIINKFGHVPSCKLLKKFKKYFMIL